MANIVECQNLTHYYGKHLVYENMSFNIKKGSIFALLGKNGTGKTTTINILNGYLKPKSGQCLIMGYDSLHLPPHIKEKIGFLIEGHIQYSFMTISQIEKFYAAFYPDWRRDAYYELMEKLDISYNQRIYTLSCGQRSQLALGLILAQNPDMMILDDYSMGLDAGYRKVFLDYLSEYVKSGNKTLFITSHIIQDLEYFVKDVVILGYHDILYSGTVNNLKENYRLYRFDLNNSHHPILKDDIVDNLEIFRNHVNLYSYHDLRTIEKYLERNQINYKHIHEIPMTLEDIFIGITGKY
ncbi:MAG: ABC transporter ATP-binding protein [Calditrichaceae bacterium]|nr:ABC transporter ATP-binding protein [Calditrichaceae bacterium]MBN2708389.1 ABC transporter ATP-binding protein [Calditrichaceae bacterium]